jgi:7-carboxy-7-deazaguanine synthase
VTTTAATLVVSEIFGPTLQGEGPSLGRRAAFVRLGRCNLACAWCDTPYTWRWEDHDPAVELRTMSTDDIAARIETMDVPLVVITGGEPLLQQRHLVPLLERLAVMPGSDVDVAVEVEVDVDVEVETAGTLAPADAIVERVTRFNVSPKLANSGNAIEHRYKPEVLRAFVATGKAAFKFVVAGATELAEVQEIVDACGIAAPAVWVMPEGTDAATLLARGTELADPVVKRGWNLTTRLQILLWGDERGR